MALSTEQLLDLTQYKDLSVHVVTILNEQASLSCDIRQVTPENIAKINILYSNTLDRMNAIVLSQGTLTHPVIQPLP